MEAGYQMQHQTTDASSRISSMLQQCLATEFAVNTGYDG